MTAKTATRRKLSVTLDSGLADQIRAEAGPGRVSKWMNDAALLRLQGENFARLRSNLGVTIDDKIVAEVAAEWPADD